MVNPGDDEGLATPQQVRWAGVFCLTSSGALLGFFQGQYLRGLVPVWWLGVLVLVLGAWCLLLPETPWLRRRVGRLVSITSNDR